MSNIERLHPRPRTDRVAVLLNANAKAVSDSLRRDLEAFVPADDLFLSHTFDDARRIAHEVLERGYTTLLTGGGDGTFVGAVNCLFDAAAARPAGTRAAGAAALQLAHTLQLPRFGVLRLGTGNALAEFTGSSSRRVGVIEDLLRARSGEVSRTRALHLLQVDGKRAPFAGLGLDAAILNDYVGVKRTLQERGLKRHGAGALGYFLAVVGRTIPSVLRQRTVPEVEVVNLGGPARQLGPDGKPVGRELGHGEILFRGRCRLAAAGTVPYYGYGFQIFPHALRAPGRFQLRLSSMGVAKTLANVRNVWRGGTPRTGVLDFHCDRALIRFDREMPFQIGGDAEGYRSELVLGMAEQPVDVLDFRAAGALRRA